MAVGELRCIVKHQNWTIVRPSEAISRRSKVTCQNIGLTDPIIAEETIGSLRIGPVLACPRRSCTNATRQLLQQLSQSLAKAGVRKLTSHDFIVYPRIWTSRIGLAET
jgi:hypothetical protein